MPLPVETAAWKDGEALPAGSAAPSEPFRGVAIEAFDSAIPAPSSPHESLVSPTLCLVPRARLPNGKAHRERAPRAHFDLTLLQIFRPRRPRSRAGDFLDHLSDRQDLSEQQSKGRAGSTLRLAGLSRQRSILAPAARART